MSDPIAAFLGPWSQGLSTSGILFRIVLAFALSAMIGCERSSKRHSAGLRTFVVVTLTTTVSMLLDISLLGSDRTLFPLLSGAAILSISMFSVHSLWISSRGQIKGLTTAAAIGACGMIGLAIGAGAYLLSLIAFLALLVCLNWFPAAEGYLKDHSNHFELQLELHDATFLPNFVSTLRRLGLVVDDIAPNDAYADTGLNVYSIAVSISSQALKQYKTHAQIMEALQCLDYIHHIEELHS